MALNQAQPYFPSLDVYRENMQCFGWRHMTYFVLKGLISYFINFREIQHSCYVVLLTFSHETDSFD